MITKLDVTIVENSRNDRYSVFVTTAKGKYAAIIKSAKTGKTYRAAGVLAEQARAKAYAQFAAAEPHNR